MEVVIDGITYVPKQQKEEPRQIDWSKVASHVPVRVWNDDPMEKQLRFLTGFGRYSNRTFRTGVCIWKHADLLTELWVPHISDECPLPDGVMVEFVQRNGREPTEPICVNGVYWDQSNARADIIRFRVTGLAEGWRW